MAWGEANGPDPIRERDEEIRLLRHAVRSLFEQAAQSGNRTVMVVGTERDIAAVQAAVQRALVEHPEDPTLGAPEAHIVHAEDDWWVLVHPARCHGDDGCADGDVRARFDAWVRATGRRISDGNYAVLIDVDGSTLVREIVSAP